MIGVNSFRFNGNTKSYDYVEGRTGRFQTLVTAVVSNHNLIDSLDVVVQKPSREKEEIAKANA
jgi:hypothetical protein